MGIASSDKNSDAWNDAANDPKLKRNEEQKPTDEQLTQMLLQFIAAAKAEIPENSKSGPAKEKKTPISGRFDEENLEFLSDIGGSYTTMMNCLVTVFRKESIRLGLYTPPVEPDVESADIPKAGMS